ncbi:MAG: deoxyribose-phosphate aldolase [Spirochaetales bacterium]|nr:deoxyribose-phosphate aldolase [Spirochaetales bacterium]
MTQKEAASYIDHTLLAPQAGIKQIITLCKEAIQYEFASVCVNSSNVGIAKNELEGSNVKVCTVVGFPLGACISKIKALEAKNAIRDGADEIDMVINIGAAKDGRFSVVSSDIASVVHACRMEGERQNKKIVVKTILETCFLDDSQIKDCCLCALKAGADYVKTSTGFAIPKDVDGRQLPNGANEHHVRLMRSVVKDKMGVKASGGIRSARTVIDMLEAGASRIGTSNSVNIIELWDESVPVRIPDYKL